MVVSFEDAVGSNYRVCRNALREPAMHMTLLFVVLEGCSVPNFLEFIYYFATNEVGMSQIEWGLSILLVFVGILGMVVIYSKFFRDAEPRRVVVYSIGCFLVACALQLMFVTSDYKSMTKQGLFICLALQATL
jgi:Na+/melibiose symporter-like transporter